MRLFLFLPLLLLGCRKAPTEIHERASDSHGDSASATDPSDASLGEATSKDAALGELPKDALHALTQRMHYDTPDALRALTLSADRDAGPALGLWHFRYVPGFWSQGKK